MPARYYRPHEPLSDYVELFWLSEGVPPAHTRERHLPSGTMQVIVNLRRDTLRVYGQDGQEREGPVTTVRGPLVTGPRDEYAVLDATQQEALLGIQFRPDGALPFLGMPTNELRNAYVALEALWGTAAHELRERVLAAATAQARFETLEAALSVRLAQAADGRYAAPHPAVGFALREFHTVPHAHVVTEVAERIGLGPRRFAQVFGEAVGLTPKAYCRVRRFQTAIRGIAGAETVSWAEIAASCGYYDQAHFIHDFRAFSGLTPSAYLARRGEHHNHVPLGA